MRNLRRWRSYREFGMYSPTTIVARFGSWNNGLLKAGLILNDEKNVPVEALWDNLKLVWIAKGKQPVWRDVNVPPSQYNGSTYCDRFEGWRKALERFVVAFDAEQMILIGNALEPRTITPPRDRNAILCYL